MNTRPLFKHRKAVIVDVDGTLCDVTSARHHVLGEEKDFNKFHEASRECPPHQEVLDWCKKMYDDGHDLIIVTARMYKHHDLTEAWLNEHLMYEYAGPFMRGDDDFRSDVEIKRDIHRILTEDLGYDICHAIDDNPAIIDLWTSLGIPTRIVPGWYKPEDYVPLTPELN